MAVCGKSLLIVIILCSLLELSAASVHYGPLPVFKVAGTHYEVAVAIGRKFKTAIHTAMSSSMFYNDKMLPYYNTADGKKLYDSLTQEAMLSFPQYVEEIQGLANGTGLPFYKMMLWNMQFEWQLHMGRSLPSPSCSDLFISGGQQQLVVGHNEDGLPVDVNTTYVIQADITDSDGQSLEQFTALCYAGQLCGNAFGFNHLGLACSVNAVFPKLMTSDGIVRNIINRAVLALKPHTVPIFLESFTCASGFSLNVIDMTAETVANIEVAPTGVSLKVIQGYDYHFNMYLHLNVSQFSDPSSLHRLARVKALPAPQNPETVLHILGDTVDKEYPIFRTDTASDHVDTLCTALFQVTDGVLKVYRGNPATSGVQPVLTFSLPKGTS